MSCSISLRSAKKRHQATPDNPSLPGKRPILILVEGNFSLLGPIDLLQLLSQSKQSGGFYVPRGEIYLDKGRPVHASYRGIGGAEGLYRILGLREGPFRFSSGDRTPEQTLTESLEHYLLQAIRQLDERIEVGVFDRVVLTVNNLPSQLTLLPNELAVLSQLNDPLSPLELSARSKFGLEAITALLGHLARLGLVKVQRRLAHTAQLRTALTEGRGTMARLDPLVIRAWTHQYGRFEAVEVQAGERQVRLMIEAQPGAGARMLLTAEGLVFHNLRAEQEVLVWPAL